MSLFIGVPTVKHGGLDGDQQEKVISYGSADRKNSSWVTWLGTGENLF